MEKIISVTYVAFVVSAEIHERKRAACAADKWLIYRELCRFMSMVEDVVVPQEAGDPGRNFTNHGCEARGI